MTPQKKLNLFVYAICLYCIVACAIVVYAVWKHDIKHHKQIEMLQRECGK